MSCFKTHTATATTRRATCTTATTSTRNGQKMWSKIEAALAQVESEKQILLIE